MEKTDISTDLKLQDFEKLAARQPNLEGNWIYQVIRTVIFEIVDKMYPKFDIYEEIPVWFLTFQEAETYVKELSTDNESNDKEQTYCFHIVQYPLRCPAESGARWLFDYEGNLIDFSITTWRGDALSTTFFGRPKSRNRFKCGDIVEVIDGEEVTLAVIVYNPPSPKWCYELYQRCHNDDEDGPMPYFLDASDDCCYLIDGPGYDYHSHVSPLFIMKPRFPIPENLEKEMKGWLKLLDKPTQES